MSAHEWRYLPRGKVKHALVDTGRRNALCGMWVWDADDWYGTGSQREYEQVAALPECRRCRRRNELEQGLARPPAQRLVQEADIERDDVLEGHGDWYWGEGR